MPEEIIPIFHAADAEALSDGYRRLGFEVESEHRFAGSVSISRSTEATPSALASATCTWLTWTRSLETSVWALPSSLGGAR